MVDEARQRVRRRVERRIATGEPRRDLTPIACDREVERHERSQREQPDAGEQLGGARLEQQILGRCDG